MDIPEGMKEAYVAVGVCPSQLQYTGNPDDGHYRDDEEEPTRHDRHIEQVMVEFRKLDRG